ncbi:hypothetical protein BOTBODRAFT_63676 [Botryobasidium botryosum FD-172 SS1]|uniref:Inositol polyphosphate-related phosphatase domain-containing protein n=1 Tax=Botryobasidium botryosum (strain FD-172 SS1) TaxID=930990 RepID=A0A067MQC1_BOTB1|nr:hypothetical protein BOTBODRAFT_63676 [Botryobasidium botryosum FD-172 SS1]
MSGLLVQIASYNTNLQGAFALPQDLVDWLAPTLDTTRKEADRSPDIVAVGFQELLPLHLGFSGLSGPVLASRDALIRAQIEVHAAKKDGARYTLVGKVVNVGVALLVYARDDGIGRRVCDVQTQWAGCGPLGMGNKGGVGVRFRVRDEDGGPGEVFTFVAAHLAAHTHNTQRRIQDFTNIVSNLVFPPTPVSTSWTTIYNTSHLFFFGDLNFRLSLPPSITREVVLDKMGTLAGREEAKQWDELSLKRKEGVVLAGMNEGEFWKFPCSYKFIVGEENAYSKKRFPAWTDRIFYATHASTITPLIYTTIHSYTTSDHKPITALLFIPSPPTPTSPTSPPLLQHPGTPFAPASALTYYSTRATGKTLDLLVGWIWYMLRVIGIGHAGVGVGNFVLGLGAIAWWKALWPRA